MIDLRSGADVRKVMREALGAAAGIDPNTITDGARILQPPPPADNLNLSAETVSTLIVACASRLLGTKVTATFQPDIVPPDAVALQTFGALANALHVHFNSVAQSAVFLTICEGLGGDPADITANIPISHVDDAGRRSFRSDVRDSVRKRICDTGSFEFTQTRAASLMDAKTVEAAMDATIGGLKDAISANRCI